MATYFRSLLGNIRFYILVFSFIFSIVVSLSVSAILSQQIYALTSLVFLYFALLAGPFCYTFPKFPWNQQFTKARRAIGVGSFYFALLHVLLVFFNQLGGFEGLGFLDTNYLTAIIVGFIALVILLLLTITSVDWAVRIMQFKNWKLLHRLVYLAGILVLIHTVMLGTHFGDLSGNIPQITFFALAFLLLLEAPRFEKYFIKMGINTRFGISTILMVLVLNSVYFMFLSPFISTGQNFSFDTHSAHKNLAKQANENQTQVSSIPGLQGDRNLRYTVNFLKPDVVQPNQETTMRFQVIDAQNGNQVSLFRKVYEKPMHVIVVDDALEYFAHVHPVQKADDFVLTTTFPHPGRYRLYLTFQPWNAIEQQVAFSLPVGNNTARQSNHVVDSNQTKKFGNYEVSLNTHGPLNAEAMSFGKQIISLTVKDGKSKQPVTTIQPYLGAFGHMTMINQKDYTFLHIHPANLTILKPEDRGGPTIDFLPIGIYGSFKPGMYRMFAEFNLDGTILLTDFTVTVE